jgi:fructokinase
MKKIYAIGEALVDIIFRQGQPQFAKAGGSMLNTVVSLGRIGLPVSFISEYGKDDAGNLIDTFLKENGVNTDSVCHFINGNTALALAFLNEKNDANYTFYKDYPQNRLDMTFPDIDQDDIFLYGSIYSITQEIRDKFFKLIKTARVNDALLIYDPNIRKAHLAEMESHKPLITENIQCADLIRGSDEDFHNIFGANNADEAWEAIRNDCQCMVYTANTEGVSIRTTSFSGSFPVKKISPVSTIGAGDNFNAGLITSFHHLNLKGKDLPMIEKKEWEIIISTAVEFASNVCMSYDNYIDRAFASKYRSASALQI